MSQDSLQIARTAEGWTLRRCGAPIATFATLGEAVGGGRALQPAAAGRAALILIDCQCARPVWPIRPLPARAQRR